MKERTLFWTCYYDFLSIPRQAKNIKIINEYIQPQPSPASRRLVMMTELYFSCKYYEWHWLSPKHTGNGSLLCEGTDLLGEQRVPFYAISNKQSSTRQPIGLVLLWRPNSGKTPRYSNLSGGWIWSGYWVIFTITNSPGRFMLQIVHYIGM